MNSPCVAAFGRRSDGVALSTALLLLLGGVAIAFLIGIWFGGELERGRDASEASAGGSPRDSGAPQPQVTADAVPVPVRLATERRWPELERWLREHAGRLSGPGMRPVLEDMLTELEQAADAGHRARVARLLNGYLSIAPEDARAALMLAAMYLQLDRPQTALPALLEAARFVPTEAQRDIEAAIDLLVAATAKQLSEAGQHEQLLGFYDQMLSVRTHNDAYRLEQVRALLALGRLDDAEQLLGEVAGAGEAELVQLAEEIEFARSGLAIERDGSLVLAGALANGQVVRLMVDTGATLTALTTERLRRLGARRTGRDVRVATAGGIIEVPLFELNQLTIAGRVFEDIPVLGLDDLPGSVDGLLGMDVLDRVGWQGLQQPQGAQSP